MPPGRTTRLASDLPDESRARALREAALTLFASRGYRGTSVRDIAGALDVQGGSLYHWIPSKQRILADLMIDAMAVGVREQQQVLAEAHDDPVDKLRRLVDYHVRFHTIYRREAVIVNRELSHLDEPDRSEVLAARDTYEGRFRAVIEAGATAGAFDVTSVRLTTFAILQMGIGIAYWYRPDGLDNVDTISAEFTEFAMRLVGFAGSAI